MAQKPKKSLLRPKTSEEGLEEIQNRIEVLQKELAGRDFRASSKGDNLRILGQYIGRGFSFKEGGSPKTNQEMAELQKLRRQKEEELEMLMKKVEKFPDPEKRFP